MGRKRINNHPSLDQRRKTLRTNLTPAEASLWRVLQHSQLQGRKFRRQHSVGRYVVDFYCPSERLVVELEGSAHDGESASIRDNARERLLIAMGRTVLRLENRHVIENLEGVLDLIRQHFKSS